MKSWTALEITLLVTVCIAATLALSGFLELSRRRPDVALLMIVAISAALWVWGRRHR